MQTALPIRRVVQRTVATLCGCVFGFMAKGGGVGTGTFETFVRIFAIIFSMIILLTFVALRDFVIFFGWFKGHVGVEYGNNFKNLFIVSGRSQINVK